MKFWRMSFRAGNQGAEMFPECQRLSVAAITYPPLENTDLSQHPEGQPKELWDQLKPTQKASLHRLAYEMQPGDLIYVKQGPQIIDRGIVTHGYTFDADYRITDPDLPWTHQVGVAWSGQFQPLAILLGAEQLTVKELNAAEVERIERQAGPSAPRATRGPTTQGPRSEPLLEGSYYRESPARLKEIVPRHNKLSNEFCRWIRGVHGVAAMQEQERIDVRFRLFDRAVLAELKICYGVGPTKAIREALGQLLEYNHYPTRETAESWLIVIDEEPSAADKSFIQTLRDARALPINLGWRTRTGFAFHPRWPL